MFLSKLNTTEVHFTFLLTLKKSQRISLGRMQIVHSFFSKNKKIKNKVKSKVYSTVLNVSPGGGLVVGNRVKLLVGSRLRIRFLACPTIVGGPMPCFHKV